LNGGASNDRIDGGSSVEPNASNPNQEEPIIIGKQQTYYVEENERFLDLLITNCEPILG
jgi:hypothetical protein